MQIAGIFLLPNGTFFVELFIVFVLLFITSKFILPPLTKAMDERDADVRSSIAAAESARADAVQADEERRSVIEQGRVEAREILGQAHAAAEQARSEAQARAQVEYERIVTGAASEVAQARTEAIEEAAPQLGTIVMGVVERVIGRQVDMGRHQDLVDGAVAELRSRASAGQSEVTA
jgi:F-type H+-transporting ATPase subunit b